MDNPCEWCQSTSEQIDSLEHQVEQLRKTIAKAEANKKFDHTWEGEYQDDGSGD